MRLVLEQSQKLNSPSDFLITRKSQNVLSSWILNTLQMSIKNNKASRITNAYKKWTKVSVKWYQRPKDSTLTKTDKENKSIELFLTTKLSNHVSNYTNSQTCNAVIISHQSNLLLLNKQKAHIRQRMTNQST